MCSLDHKQGKEAEHHLRMYPGREVRAARMRSWLWFMFWGESGDDGSNKGRLR